MIHSVIKTHQIREARDLKHISGRYEWEKQATYGLRCSTFCKSSGRAWFSTWLLRWMVRPSDWTKEARRPITIPTGIETPGLPPTAVMKEVGMRSGWIVNECVTVWDHYTPPPCIAP